MPEPMGIRGQGCVECLNAELMVMEDTGRMSPVFSIPSGGAPHEITALLTHLPLFPGDFHFYPVHVWGGPWPGSPPTFLLP